MNLRQKCKAYKRELDRKRYDFEPPRLFTHYAEVHEYRASTVDNRLTYPLDLEVAVEYMKRELAHELYKAISENIVYTRTGNRLTASVFVGRGREDYT